MHLAAPPRHRLNRLALILLLATAALGSPALRAQNTLTESDKQRILEQLGKLKKSTREAKFGRYTSALAAYQAAAETPAKAYDFYLDCVKLVNYDQEGKKFSEYRDWKAANVQKLRATEHTVMLQFQLRYLVMTIRALNMEDRSQIIPDLQAFITAAVERRELMGEHAKALNRSVASSVFARAYGLDSALNGDAAWELAPLNVMGHYQKTIFPIYREQGDARALELGWDRLINLEIAIMEPVKDEKAKDDFVQKRLPTLRWAKWSDVAENGARAKAALAMLEHLEKYQRHDDAEAWIQDLVDVVNGGTVSDADFQRTPAPPPAEPSGAPAP